MTAFLESIAMGFDFPILDWIAQHLQSGFMDVLMPIITMFGDAGIFWIACALILAIIPKTRKIGLSMGVALVLGLLVCNITLKPLFHRIRPYDLQAKMGNVIQLLVSTPSDYSFPSGHTIASFEACTVLLIKDKRLGIPALILAIAIAFSRLYLYVHYPTDVLVSVVLGILFGFLGVKIVDAIAASGIGKKGKYQR